MQGGKEGGVRARMGVMGARREVGEKRKGSSEMMMVEVVIGNGV